MNYADKAAFFDAQAGAPWADAEYGETELAKVRRITALLPKKRSLHLLEPGCGTGRLTELLAVHVGPQGSVMALDISDGMVAAARQRLAHLPNAEALMADLESCVLPLRAYDAVICHQVFPHFNDPADALARMAGLLRPGGQVVVSHFISRAEVNDVHRKAGTAVEADMLPDEPGIRALFRAAGFEVSLLEDGEDIYLLNAHKRV